MSMPDTSFYTVAKKPPIAWVHLNRPDKKNAMNPPAWHEAPPLFEDLDQDPDIRVVILAAHGSCFSVGIDLVEMAGELPEIMEREQMGGVKWRLLKRIGALQKTMSCIERCRKPVIAAIHGYCIGAGLDMVTACDIRLCSRDAVFARELAFTAKTIDAARAREILLVNEVFDDQATLMAGAQAMAEAIAANAPLAVEATKNVLNYGVGKSIDDGLRYVASMSTNIVPSKDLMEAFTAFMEKRPPAFTGH
jgi:enoyl-CoA hydratase